MKCKEKNCKGELQTKKTIKVRISCEKNDIAYPCIACGRLYWRTGEPIFNRSGEKAYWNWERERLENRNDQGDIIESEKKLSITLDFTLEQYKMIRNMASMKGEKEKDFLEKIIEKHLMHRDCDWPGVLG